MYTHENELIPSLLAPREVEEPSSMIHGSGHSIGLLANTNVDLSEEDSRFFEERLGQLDEELARIREAESGSDT